MVLFTFRYDKNMSDGTVLSIPAVYFTNKSYNTKEVRELYPGLNYVTTYPINLDYLDVPLDTLLYEDDKVIDLLSINAELEKENRELRNKLEMNVGVNSGKDISYIGEGNSDEPIYTETLNKEDQTKESDKKMEVA